MAKSIITRKTRKLTTRERNAALDDLVESERIIQITHQTKGKSAFKYLIAS